MPRSAVEKVIDLTVSEANLPKAIEEADLFSEEGDDYERYASAVRNFFEKVDNDGVNSKPREIIDKLGEDSQDFPL